MVNLLNAFTACDDTVSDQCEISEAETWRQRRLSFDSKATIESVYKQADALVALAPASSALQSTYARMAAASLSGGGASAGSANVAAESVPASSTNLKTPFLLVQATTSGFGAWFLDETGLGANLVDGLDLEAICGPMDSSNLQTRQKNLIYGDSLFLVHLKNSWNTAVDDYPNGGADSMEVDDTDEEGGMLRILLIHVTESGKQEDEEEHAISDTYRAVGENAGPAPKFHRFSPPFLISVRSDIQFDELRKCATRALTDFLGCPPLEGDRAFEEDGLLEAFFGLRFWIVDAGPGEACEILDEPDCYPLLHPTVDLSSVPVPSWMLPASKGGSSSQPLKLLRLLAVWPTAKLPPFPIPPPTPSYPLDKDPLALTTPPPGKRGRRSDFNARPSHSMHFSSSKGKHSANSVQPLSSAVPMDPPSTASSSAASSAEFTLNDCLKAFIESERPADDKWKCPRCARKNHSNPLLLTKLLNAPDYLLLHLNRFVQAPCSEGQDDATATLPWFSGSKASPPSSLLYDLVAVCNHKGQLDSGHYTAICRNLFTNQWWHYSDQKVVKVSADQVVQASAYILFYRKRTACSSRELRSLRQTLAELARESLSTSPSVSPLSAEEPTASTGRAHHTATGPDLEGERGRSLQSPISLVQSPTDPVDTRRRRQTSSAAHSPWHSKADQAQPAREVGRDQPNVGDNVAQRQPPPLLPKPRADERKFQSVSTKPPSLLCDTDSDCVQGRRSSGVYRLTTPDNEGVKKLETSRPSPASRHNSTVKMSKF
nr:unnamed protein product [Spirometra erinaceieuropaei]